MTKALFPYQRTGAAWLAQPGNKLLADEQRVGKAVQAVQACNYILAQNPLIVCDANARFNWEREFRIWAVEDIETTVVLSGDTKIPMTGRVIVNYDLVRSPKIHKQLMRRHNDLLILDESQRLANPGAKRTRAVFGPKGDGGGGLVSTAERVWALSGTPARNHPGELYPLLRACFPDLLRRDGRIISYWSFVGRYCLTIETNFGTKIVGGKNASELRALLSGVMLRRTRQEVRPELPPLRFGDVVLPPGDLIKEIREMEAGPEGDALRKALADSNDPLLALESASSSAPALRRLLGQAKVGPVAELVADELQKGEGKIVLFAYHRAVVEGLRDKLAEFGPCVYYGGMSPKAKQASIDAFMQDPSRRVYIGQIEASSTSINLSAADDILFVESSWVPTDNEQAACRCLDITKSGRDVCVRFCSVAGSMDEAIQAAARKKLEMLTAIFG